MVKHFINQNFNNKREKIKTFTQTKLIILTTLFVVLVNNYSFFKNTLKIYPLEFNNIGFLLSLAIVLIASTTLLLTLVSSKHTIKPILIIILIVSSLTNYFMNAYQVVIDDDMIRNMMQTDLKESMDLITIKQIIYFLFLGLLPSYFIYKSKIQYSNLKVELLSKIKIIFLALLLIVACILIFSKHYTSFIRENKPLRYSTNPTYWIYSIGKYIGSTFSSNEIIVKPIGVDAKVIELDDDDGDDDHTELVILIVGEAARADHFSLNGYEKETNPLLKKEDIINFSNMYSCGTSTAHSLPCMFSIFDKPDYSYKRGISTQNILDVLSHTKEIEILWRDNNSNSKGVALRVPYEDYRTPKNNTMCSDGECRDEGMLIGLEQYIDKHKGKDILIVLHQMGNHGPAYYKRYPKKFEKFTPVCKTNQLEQCSQNEISNAYDNAILYTDYFLSKTINFLKKYDKSHETAMIYMSDHGESLGENGIYLHGLPYFMAPDAQTHIGSLMWFGDEISKDINITVLKQNRDKKFSHDNLFHTLLNIFEVETDVYRKDMDILNVN